MRRILTTVDNKEVFACDKENIQGKVIKNGYVYAIIKEGRRIMYMDVITW